MYPRPDLERDGPGVRSVVPTDLAVGLEGHYDRMASNITYPLIHHSWRASVLLCVRACVRACVRVHARSMKWRSRACVCERARWCERVQIRWCAVRHHISPAPRELTSSIKCMLYFRCATPSFEGESGACCHPIPPSTSGARRVINRAQRKPLDVLRAPQWSFDRYWYKCTICSGDVSVTRGLSSPQWVREASYFVC